MAKLNYDTLPKKRMGAGCLIFNEQNQVLLVNPSYKPGWEIPGGIIEQNESPRQCCQREVKEELGLDLGVSRLLLVEYNRPVDVKIESLMFVFAGGMLSVAEIDQIQLQAEELLDYQFFSQAALPLEMTANLRNRVQQAWQQVSQQGTRYIENLQLIGT